MTSPLAAAYRPERPSVWRDLRAIPLVPRQGAPMFLPFVLVWLAALWMEIFHV